MQICSDLLKTFSFCHFNGRSRITGLCNGVGGFDLQYDLSDSDCIEVDMEFFSGKRREFTV